MPSSDELELGAGLIEKLSSENFEPEAYRDEYRNRVLALIDEKAKGREITVPPKVAGTRPGHRSHGRMKTVERGKKKADQKTRRKA